MVAKPGGQTAIDCESSSPKPVWGRWLQVVSGSHIFSISPGSGHMFQNPRLSWPKTQSEESYSGQLTPVQISPPGPQGL